MGDNENHVHAHLDNRSISKQHAIFDSVMYSKLIPTLFYLVFVVGACGNSLVVCVLRKLNRKRNISDVFLLNLTCADLLFLSILPAWSSEFALHGNWAFGNIFCKIASFITLTSAYGSVFFLTLMSLDRVSGVVFYKSCKKYRTVKTAWISAACAWFLAVTSSILAFHYRGEFTNLKTGHIHCQWQFDHTDFHDRKWYFLHMGLRLILGFAIPLAIMTACYVTIGLYLTRRSSSKEAIRNKQVRLTKLFFALMVIFTLCWAPNEISTAMYTIKRLNGETHSSLGHFYFHIFSTCLGWTHSAVNPFLYGFMRTDFRIKFVEMQNQLLAFRRVRQNRKAEQSSDPALKRRKSFDKLDEMPNNNQRDGIYLAPIAQGAQNSSCPTLKTDLYSTTPNFVSQI